MYFPASSPSCSRTLLPWISSICLCSTSVIGDPVTLEDEEAIEAAYDYAWSPYVDTTTALFYNAYIAEGSLKQNGKAVDAYAKLEAAMAALEALKDPEVDALKKNALLKACIDRITYTRERVQRLAVKVTKFESGWTDTPIILDVKLKV